MYTTHKGIDERELYKALSGHSIRYIPGRIGSEGRVSIDTTVETEMDRAFILVKKFEREQKKWVFHRYRSYFKGVDEAYVSGDSGNFDLALNQLLRSIETER